MLTRQLGRTIHVVAISKPQTQAALRNTYQGIADAFNRIQKHERQAELDSEAMQDLRSLLFGPVIGIEAIRLTRAEALVAAAKMSSSLAKEFDGEVRALIETEVASSVRDRLAEAQLTQ